MPISQIRLGENVRRAREQLGITRANLADSAGFSAHQIVSEIELGNRDVKASELARIARALCIDINSLLGEEMPASCVCWRKRPSEANSIEVRFVELAKRYASARTACGAPKPKSLPQETERPTSYTDAENLAGEIRRRFDLGSRPASSLAKVLESEFGVFIWYRDLGEDGSGACTRGEFGEAILINRSEAPWRRNFDLAHELFHLLTWLVFSPELLETDPQMRENSERFADVFASNLLLPAETLMLELERRKSESGIAWVELVNLARDFDVSTQALLWRLRTLRWFDANQVKELLANDAFRALDRGSMSGYWWKPPELPESYVRMAFHAHAKGCMSRARLAEILDSSLIDLPSKLEEYGIFESDDYQNILLTA